MKLGALLRAGEGWGAPARGVRLLLWRERGCTSGRAGVVLLCLFFFSFFSPKGAVFAQHRMRRTFYFLVIAFKVVVLE